LQGLGIKILVWPRAECKCQYTHKLHIVPFPGVLLWELWTAAELPYAGLNDQQVTGQVTVPMY